MRARVSGRRIASEERGLGKVRRVGSTEEESSGMGYGCCVKIFFSFSAGDAGVLGMGRVSRLRVGVLI
jgi:hypothetical protein